MVINNIEELENLEYALRKYLENLKGTIEEQEYNEERTKKRYREYIDSELVMLKDLNKSLNKTYTKITKELEKE